MQLRIQWRSQSVENGTTVTTLGLRKPTFPNSAQDACKRGLKREVHRYALYPTESQKLHKKRCAYPPNGFFLNNIIPDPYSTGKVNMHFHRIFHPSKGLDHQPPQQPYHAQIFSACNFFLGIRLRGNKTRN